MNIENYISVPFISGISAGLFSTVMCNPLDVAKIRLQVQGSLGKLHKKYSGGTIPTISTIYREEGLKGLFKGLEVALMTIPLFWGIYFYSYDWSKRKFGELFPGAPNVAVHMVSAVASGGLGNIIVNPFWVIKTRIQTQVFLASDKKEERFWEIFLNLYKKEGILGYYKGVNASLLGLSHVAIQFPIYERLKETARAYRKSEETFLDILMSSILAKVVASSITYPHEVIRARMQYDKSMRMLHVVEVFLRIAKGEGVLGLYSGYSVNLVRIIPATVSTFLAYEYISRQLTVSRRTAT